MTLRTKVFLACESFLRVPPLLVIDEIFRTSFGFGGSPFSFDHGQTSSVQGTYNSKDPTISSGHGETASITASLAELIKDSWIWGSDMMKNDTSRGHDSVLKDQVVSSIEDLARLSEEIADDLMFLGHIIGSVILFFVAVVMFTLATENLIKLYSYIVSFLTLYFAYIFLPFSFNANIGGVFLLSVNITLRTALAAVFFLCKAWPNNRITTGFQAPVILDPLLMSLFYITGFVNISPVIFVGVILLLHYPLLMSLPRLYNFLLRSWGDTKRVQNEYGLSHLIQVESGRLRINTVFRLFWMARAAYDAFYRCFDEPLSLILRNVMIHGTETFTGIVGLTVTVAAICHQIGDFILWLLYLGSNNEMDLNRFGSISTVLFFILSLQSGLTSLDPEKRLDRLMKNIALLGTALFHALHQVVAPLLHAFRSFQPVQIRAATISCVFLGIAFCLTFSLLQWTTISTWSLAVLALAIEFKIKVIISLIISLVVYLSQLVQYPDVVEKFVVFMRRILPRVVMHFFDQMYDQISHEDMVFYLKTTASVAEFLTGIFLFLNAVWIFLFESTSAIRAIGMSIHAYFNIWCEAQKGFRIYCQRKTASKKIMSLKDATEEQLKMRSDDVCSICYESFESAKVTNCGHLFHAVCLRKWLYVQNTCPMCHEILYKEETAEELGPGGDEVHIAARENLVNGNLRAAEDSDDSDADNNREIGQNNRERPVNRGWNGGNADVVHPQRRMLGEANRRTAWDADSDEDDYEDPNNLLQDIEEDSDSFVEVNDVDEWNRNGDGNDRDDRGRGDGGIQAADGRGLVLFL